MVKCPSCGIKISFRNAFFGRLHKNGCPNCGVRIKTSRGYNALMGGIGGGTGSMISSNLYKSHFSINSIIITLLWFSSFVMCLYIFSRYKVIH